MAIAPIKGMLARSVLLHISTGLGLGLAAGYTFWYGWRVAQDNKRDAYYATLKKSIA